ncbi:hypothetical protein ACFQ1S_44050, partial [Kibdelosporangium lantanae]
QSATDGSVGHSEGRGLVLTGTGMAETRGPVIDTSQSFTVSAWVKLADTNSFYAVAGQSGIQQTSFQLRYDKNVNRWVMGVSAADHGDDGYTGWLSLETHWRIGRVLTQQQRDTPWGKEFSDGGYEASVECMRQLDKLVNG